MPKSINSLKNILVAEDDIASRQAVAEAFRESSFEGVLHTVKNSDELMRVLRRQGEFKDVSVPDMVLLDLNLPGKTGLDAIREIKSDEKLKDIPIVVLTVSNAPADIQVCSQYRCKYLIKPSRFHELVNLVTMLPDFL